MTRNIQATDAQGNKVSETIQINGVDPTSSGGGGGAFEDGDGDGVAELQESHASFQGGDARNINALSTNTAQVSNESLVRAEAATNTSLSAGSWTTVILDSEAVDDRSEYDPTTYQFVPDNSGWYFVCAQAQFTSFASGDLLSIRFKDVTSATRHFQTDNIPGGTGNVAIPSMALVNLTGGNAYEFQARNNGSSDSIAGTGFVTNLSIRGAFR